MRFALIAGIALVAIGCGGSQPPVTFMSNEQPTGPEGTPDTALSKQGSHVENPNGGNAELGEDQRIEPEHPLADSKQERAVVHIHGPKDILCSGVVLGPKIVGTTQHCLKGIDQQGAYELGPDKEFRIEIASSTLTWTNRKPKYIVLPKCEWHDLDIALFVLDEAVPALVEPLKLTSAPNIGGKVQALGFGRCEGSPKNPRDRVGEIQARDAQMIQISVPLCKGDRGGPVFDTAGGDVIGLVSHRDDPQGSPLHTATIARLDTVWARDLMNQAKGIADGGDVTKATPIACK